MVDVMIVGAGPAGLFAACELAVTGSRRVSSNGAWSTTVRPEAPR